MIRAWIARALGGRVVPEGDGALLVAEDPRVRALLDAWGLAPDRRAPRGTIALLHSFGVGPNAPRGVKVALRDDGAVFTASLWPQPSPFAPEPSVRVDAAWLARFDAALERVGFEALSAVVESPVLDGGVDLLTVRRGDRVVERAFRGSEPEPVALLRALAPDR